jgi:plasmid segregation protein ParM
VVCLNGTQRKLFLEDIEVYPEGLISSEDGILLDIGGRTSDIALIENKKVKDCFSIPAGTLNLYADFINAINGRYGLDLKPSDADRIIRKGLQINGTETDVAFVQGVFKNFVDDLVSQVQVKYPVSTLPITVLGGGGQLLFKPIKNRLPNSTLVDNPIFANALLFKRVGDAKWQ